MQAGREPKLANGKNYTKNSVPGKPVSRLFLQANTMKGDGWTKRDGMMMGK